jgi:hypothetical protein
MDKYSQLAIDLKESVKMAIEAAAKVDDGGSANLDSVFIQLPRFNEEKTIQAIYGAGLSGFKTVWMGITGFIINPPCVGQGDKRNRAMEIMKDCLKEKYQVFSFYQMD